MIELYPPFLASLSGGGAALPVRRMASLKILPVRRMRRTAWTCAGSVGVGLFGFFSILSLSNFFFRIAFCWHGGLSESSFLILTG